VCSPPSVSHARARSQGCCVDGSQRGPEYTDLAYRTMRKPKPKARQGIAKAKPARNRRSAEQMLVELKQRLREISDLTAAGDILTWDQATYMPRGGADARARQCAALYGLAHEQAVAPALGKLLDALAPYGERLPRDSDDASLIRVARRDFEKMIKIPRDHVT